MSEFYLYPEDYKRAEMNGIHNRLLEQRFYSYNWDKERAITQPLPTPTIKPALLEKAERHGINPDQLRWRLDNTDLSEHEAATLSKEELFNRRVAKQSTYVAPAIKKLAEENNIKLQTVYMRIKKGMNPVKAATMKPLSPRERINKRWHQQAKI